LVDLFIQISEISSLEGNVLNKIMLSLAFF
jgi:hypothetical protein